MRPLSEVAIDPLAYKGRAGKLEVIPTANQTIQILTSVDGNRLGVEFSSAEVGRHFLRILANAIDSVFGPETPN